MSVELENKDDQMNAQWKEPRTGEKDDSNKENEDKLKEIEKVNIDTLKEIPYKAWDFIQEMSKNNNDKIDTRYGDKKSIKLTYLDRPVEYSFNFADDKGDKWGALFAFSDTFDKNDFFAGKQCWIEFKQFDSKKDENKSFRILSTLYGKVKKDPNDIDMHSIEMPTDQKKMEQYKKDHPDTHINDSQVTTIGEGSSGGELSLSDLSSIEDNNIPRQDDNLIRKNIIYQIKERFDKLLESAKTNML